MSDGEIEVVQDELDQAVKVFNILLSSINIWYGLFVKKSTGKTSTALNELYDELKLISENLIQLIDHTEKFMENAKLEFEDADFTAKEMIEKIQGAMV